MTVNETGGSGQFALQKFRPPMSQIGHFRHIAPLPTLDGDVSRLRPAQNLIDKFGRTPKQVSEVWPIGHQTTRIDVLAVTVTRGQPRDERQGVDANPVGVHERVGTDIKSFRATLERL